MEKTFDIIVAVDRKNGIGKNGALPWNLPEDMKHFKAVTLAVSDPRKQNAVIMGRKTWESIPEKFRPLTGRLNIVLTTNKAYGLPPSVIKAYSLDVALDIASSGTYQESVENIFVIGGASVYTQAIDHSRCQKIFLTRIDADFHCDTFFPSLDQKFSQQDRSSARQQGDLAYQFLIYSRM